MRAGPSDPNVHSVPYQQAHAGDPEPSASQSGLAALQCEKEVLKEPSVVGKLSLSPGQFWGDRLGTAPNEREGGPNLLGCGDSR
jgi:hypothetical protein